MPASRPRSAAVTMTIRTPARCRAAGRSWSRRAASRPDGAPRRKPMRRCLAPAAVGLGVLSAVLVLAVATPSGALDPDDPPAATRARRALSAGELGEAIRLYEIALAADPTAPYDWYNYACALARDAQADDALLALEKALRAGYADSSWTASDPDLAALRSRPRFSELTRRMAARERMRRDEIAQRFHAPQMRLASYGVELPAAYEDPPPGGFALVILLHGRGVDGASMQRLAEALALDDVVYVWMDAPYPLAEGGGGFEYWPSWTRESGQEDALAAAARLTARSYGALARDVAAGLPIDTTQVFLVGFSQGAATAYLTALENPELFAGIAPLGGYLLPAYAEEGGFVSLAAHDVALFIGHGAQDEVIDPARAEEAAALARAAGVETELHVYPIGHTVSESEIRDLSAWLRARMGRPSR
ncbi:MAG: hypothetical protein GF330_06005 [Candidatus Eisenbacteria bacterium]|nr:hypothetical protein [Candidatus Eisenbacteria bacterium]